MSAAGIRASLVAVGDELLSGAQADTNSGWLARELASLGIAVEAVELVGDDEAAIAEAVTRALGRGELVLVGGGLGPTLDDISRNGIARALGLGLEEDPEALAEVRGWFERRAVPMAEVNRRQAVFPKGARIVRNRVGTAPGFSLAVGERMLLALPGPPRELQIVWREEVVPFLRARAWTRAPLAERRFFLFGISESHFAERSGDWMARGADPRMGCTVRDGTLTASLRARSFEAQSFARLAARAEAFRQRFAEEIYSESEWEIESALTSELLAGGWTVSLAESCTGGLAMALLTRRPGISRVLGQGTVVYSDQAKQELLGVPAEALRVHGAVSREVAEAMALGAARRSGADLGLSISGIAGPDGGSEAKPVGLVWFGASFGGQVECVERRFPPVDRESIRRLAARTALFLGWKRIRSRPRRAD